MAMASFSTSRFKTHDFSCRLIRACNCDFRYGNGRHALFCESRRRLNKCDCSFMEEKGGGYLHKWNCTFVLSTRATSSISENNCNCQANVVEGQAREVSNEVVLFSEKSTPTEEDYKNLWSASVVKWVKGTIGDKYGFVSFATYIGSKEEVLQRAMRAREEKAKNSQALISDFDIFLFEIRQRTKPVEVEMLDI